MNHILRSSIAAYTKNMSVENDLSPAFTIYHTGGPSVSSLTATAVTSASVTFDTGDDFTFKVNGAADTRFGTGGKVDASTETGTYDSMSELYTFVNSISGWAMRLEGAIPTDLIDDTTRHVLVKADTDCFRKPVTFYWDTDEAEMHNFVISNRRTAIIDGTEVHEKGKLAMIEDEGGAINVLDYLKVNFNIAGTNPTLTLYLYSMNGRTQTATLIATQALTDNAASTWDFTRMGGLTAKPGEYLVGRIVCATPVESDEDIGTLTTFRCIGRSIGGRWSA